MHCRAALRGVVLTEILGRRIFDLNLRKAVRQCRLASSPGLSAIKRTYTDALLSLGHLQYERTIEVWLANCYFAHFSSGSQTQCNIVTLRSKLATRSIRQGHGKPRKLNVHIRKDSFLDRKHYLRASSQFVMASITSVPQHVTCRTAFVSAASRSKTSMA